MLYCRHEPDGSQFTTEADQFKRECEFELRNPTELRILVRAQKSSFRPRPTVVQ